jgi:hypothetical protein
MTLFQSLALIPTDVNLMITWSRNPQSRLRFDLQQITSLCQNFLWSGDILRSKSALVAWKFVYLPKKEGGLGLPDLKAHNSSFIAKQL